MKSKFPPKRFTTLAAVKEKNVSAIKERVDRTQQKIQGSKYKGKILYRTYLLLTGDYLDENKRKRGREWPIFTARRKFHLSRMRTNEDHCKCNLKTENLI